MRKTMSVLLVGLMFSGVASNASAVAYRGARSCSVWISDRQEAKYSDISDKAWLVGFLSGIAVGLQNNFLDNRSVDSFYLWMDNYCRTNPLNDTAEGGAALARELINSR